MDEQKLKIYCPVHPVEQEILRSKTLFCKLGQHTLSSKFPFEEFWMYCCDCGSFSPFENGGGRVTNSDGRVARDRCWVCGRGAEYWYLCHQCNVFITQSAAEVKGKAFSLSSGGYDGPAPACPGCLSKAKPKIEEHVCCVLLDSEVVGYTTPRKSCPLCGEDIASAAGTPKGAALHFKHTHLTTSGEAHLLNPAGPSAERSDHQEAHMLIRLVKWVRAHLLVSFLVSVAASLLVAFLYDKYKEYIGWVPAPVVTRIAAQRLVVREGMSVDIWAETLANDRKPEKYYWEPEDKIINNGQQRVTLKAEAAGRHTWPYTITVSLTPIASDGTTLQAPKPIDITVESEAQSNNKPEIIRRIRSNPEGQEVRAGDSFTLEAVATDDDREDRERLRYNWYVENDAAQVEGNGNSRVRIITPANLARYSSVPLKVSLTVSDGHDGGVANDEATLMVVPKPKSSHKKPGPPKYLIIVQPTINPSQGTHAAAPTLAAPPQQPPAKQPPPQSNAQPAKQGKESTQDGAP